MQIASARFAFIILYCFNLGNYTRDSNLMRDITVSGVKYFSSDYMVKQGSQNVMKSAIETIHK